MRRTFFDILPHSFPDGCHHLALGDFNVPIDPSLDERVASRTSPGVAELLNWQLRLGVVDAWRTFHPLLREFTGPGRRNRIDYGFASSELLEDYVVCFDHVKDKIWHHADHLPLSFTLQSPLYPQRTQLPWKCPSWLLKHPAVSAVLGHSLDALRARIRTGIADNPGALYDEHKRADGIYLRQMFHVLKNSDAVVERYLTQDLHEATCAHATENSEPSATSLLAARDALATHKAFIQSRCEAAKFDKDVSTGESGSSYFFRSPSSVNLRVSIPSATRPDGSSTTDPDEMAEVHRKYWGSLYRSPSHDFISSTSVSPFQPLELLRLLRHTTSCISSADQVHLDAPMTANDFYWAITTSGRGRSSGLDGLPIEYFQLSPHKWAQVLEGVYASQLRLGRMTKFQRRASITLLHKSGDRGDPSNYRPITLLNHDAKLGPKIMAHRLRNVLPHVLHGDQSGFVSGRSIRHSLARFQDLQQFCSSSGRTQAGAVLLDFAKAFDSVLWPALRLVLEHMGFGPHFLHCVKTFYTGTLVAVLVNGRASRYFELGCGVRQDATRHHLLAFADDCTGFLDDLAETPLFLRTVRGYADAAGLKLNVSKTKLLPFTACAPELRSSLVELGFTVVADNASTKLLGIDQSPCLPVCRRYDRILPLLVSRCLLWRYRARTLRGRAVILRTIILPLLWYTAAVTPMPPAVAAQVTLLCKAFLFKRVIGSPSSIRGPLAEEWLYWPTSRGGLGLPNVAIFAQTLLLCSLRDAVSSAGSPCIISRWSSPAIALFSMPLGPSGSGFDILYCAVPKSVAPTPQWALLGRFWYAALQTWQRLRDSSHHTSALSQFLLDAPLWRNVYFKVGTLGRLLEDSSTLVTHFRNLGYVRLRDFLLRHGRLPDKALCLSILAGVAFGSPPTALARCLAISFQIITLVPRLGCCFIWAGPPCPPVQRASWLVLSRSPLWSPP
ncbi:unnamed protein product [Peronospora farinosa]|uniref:Reverse transcriptase domain-containing protein n=1 Tax=Peronospora farinosa TaxID=134698 RepID=A0ABN8C699_9STRA|nr:unnamed protein product [Peronospora farinosa]